MRPPGGYSPDMMNFANDIDVYQIYAQMCKDNTVRYKTSRPYYCVYTGRRDHYQYKNSIADIMQKYGPNIMMHERMPEILSSAMGNEFYIARFTNEKDMKKFSSFIFQKTKEPKK